MPSKHFLREAVNHTLKQYLAATEGGLAINIHDMVIAEVESALIEIIIRHTGGNQSEAAKILGLSRVTLGKLLKKYKLIPFNL